MAGIDTNTKLLLRPFTSSVANGSKEILDSTGRHVVTQVLNAGLSTVDKKFGSSSLYLDSSASYCTVGDSTDWAFGAGDFTIDFWVNFQSYPNVYSTLVCQDLAGSSFWVFLQENGGTLRFKAYNSAQLGEFTTSFSPNFDQWYHIAFVRSGSTAYMFIDGVSQSVTTIFGFGNMPDIAADLKIGYCASYASGQYSNFYMDDLRITKGQALWTSDFTPPTEEVTEDPNTVLLLNMESQDVSRLAGNTPNIPELAGNCRIDTTFYKFLPGAYRMDDSSATTCLNVPASPAFNFGAEPFTIDFWVYLHPFSGNQHVLLRQFEDFSSLTLQTTGGPSYKLQFLAANDPITVCYYEGSTILNSEEWYHIAVVRNGSNFYLFVNGIAETLTINTPVSTNAFASMTTDLSIGGQDGYSASNISIDEIRFSVGTARWTSNFTPPTEQYSLQVARPFSQGIIII